MREKWTTFCFDLKCITTAHHWGSVLHCRYSGTKSFAKHTFALWANPQTASRTPPMDKFRIKIAKISSSLSSLKTHKQVIYMEKEKYQIEAQRPEYINQEWCFFEAGANRASCCRSTVQGLWGLYSMSYFSLEQSVHSDTHQTLY